MGRVIMLSGLGADSRLFKHIELPGHEIVLTETLPVMPTDTLADYSQKFIEQYAISKNDIVIGDSLGGILAIEIAKKVSPQRTILISSIKSIAEAPRYFKWFRVVPVYKIIPDSFIKVLGVFIKPVFGHMSKEDAELFVSMLRSSSPKFIKWAMGAALHWDNKVVPANVYHIHGDADLVFPIKYIRGTVIIKGGTHIMVFDKASEINILLQNLIN